jgi:hypothetical protein
LIVLKSAIGRQVNSAVGRSAGQRHDFSRQELDLIEARFGELVAIAVAEVFDGN